MELVAWILINEFKCHLEGGFVRDWIIRGEHKYPDTINSNDFFDS